MSFLGGSHKAAQLALLRDVLGAERYPAGMALRQILRFVAADHRPVALPLACATAGLPLILVLAHGGVYIAMTLFAISGALWSIQVVVSVSFLADLLPDSQRAQGMGVASSMNLTASGLGAGLAGLVAQATNPTRAIALAGAASIPVALWFSALWLRSIHGGKTRSESSAGDSEPDFPLAIP